MGTTLHLFTRTDFNLAPRGTVIRNTHGTVGARHRDGVWYETGCSDPADQGWFRDMAGAQVIAWGGNTDPGNPDWGLVVCPDCGGRGWTASGVVCRTCGELGQLAIGRRVTPTTNPTPDLDEHRPTREWDAQVEALANRIDTALTTRRAS